MWNAEHDWLAAFLSENDRRGLKGCQTGKARRCDILPRNQPRMLMNRKKTASGARGPLLFLLIFCASATFTVFYAVASRAASNSASETSASVRQFSGVLAIIQRSYAEPVDSEKIIYDGAIPGMLHVLDPHSNFFDPRQYDSFREEQEGKYYGVGMQVASRDHLTVVVSP